MFFILLVFILVMICYDRYCVVVYFFKVCRVIKMYINCCIVMIYFMLCIFVIFYVVVLDLKGDDCNENWLFFVISYRKVYILIFFFV